MKPDNLSLTAETRRLLSTIADLGGESSWVASGLWVLIQTACPDAPLPHVKQLEWDRLLFSWRFRPGESVTVEIGCDGSIEWLAMRPGCRLTAIHRIVDPIPREAVHWLTPTLQETP